jgi:outer membrane immunogenic protein
MLLVTTGAHAADLPAPPEPEPRPPLVDYPVVVTWGGPYTGIHAGYARAQGRFSGCGCYNPVEENFAGGRIGAFAGYNWLLSNGFVAGIEGDVTYDWNSEWFRGADRVGTDLSGSIRARTGYSRGNVLIFATAGWAATNAFVDGPDDNETATGWAVGAGIDWALTEKMFVRAEYRYTDFRTVNLAGVDADLDQSSVTVGLAVKF